MATGGREIEHHFVGALFVSTNPTGGASAWQQVPEPGIEDISCPSVNLCVAVTTSEQNLQGAVEPPKLLTSTSPAGGSAAWQLSPLPSLPDEPRAISCPTAALCVAAGRDGVFSSAQPLVAGAWNYVRLRPETTPFEGWSISLFEGVSCATVTVCVVGGSAGIVGSSTNADALTTSTNPIAEAAAWTATPLMQAASSTSALGVSDISCPSAGLCVATDTGGNLLTSTNPAGGSGAWTSSPLDPAANEAQGLPAVSCASVSFCVVVDGTGSAFFSTNPAAGASSWIQQPGIARPAPLQPTASKCRVPKVKRKALGAAEAAISKAGCTTGRIKHAKPPHKHAPKGKVYTLFVTKQSPPAGTVKPVGAAVNLTLAYKLAAAHTHKAH